MNEVLLLLQERLFSDGQLVQVDAWLVARQSPDDFLAAVHARPEMSRLWWCTEMNVELSRDPERYGDQTVIGGEPEIELALGPRRANLNDILTSTGFDPDTLEHLGHDCVGIETKLGRETLPPASPSPLEPT